MTSDPIEILIASNRWATQNIIAVCKEMPEEQFRRKFEIGPGSLYSTITHILESMQHWADVLADRQMEASKEHVGTPPWLVGSFGIVYFGSHLDDQQRSPGQLSGLLDEISDDLQASARIHPTETEVIWQGDKPYTFTRGEVLTHVTTHGTHHRAQCLNMLRHLGVEPLPPTSVHEWMMMRHS